MFSLVLLILAGPEIIIIKQLSEYAMHIMLFFFLLGFVFMILKYDKLVLLSFALTAALCVFMKNGDNEEFTKHQDTLEEKVAVAHINLSNITDEPNMIKTLAYSNVEVVSFQEYTPEWVTLKEQLKTWFPYSLELLRIDPYGKAIFSKYPIFLHDTLNKNIASDVSFEIVKNNHAFNFISTYLIPSLNSKTLEAAKSQLKIINEELGYTPKSTIILGEFNMVYWSSELRHFKERSNLQNSRKEIIPVSFKVPYDHMFYTKDLQCVQLKDFLINRNERIGLYSIFQINNREKKLNDKLSLVN